MSASLVHTTLWSPASSIPLGNVDVLLIVLNNESSITDKSFVHVFRRWRLKSSDYSNEAVSRVYEGAGDWGVNSGGSLLHMAQLMPLPLTVSCFSKIQIRFYLAGTGLPGQSWKKGR